MTSAAQFALRRIIEKYTRTTRFCLIANYTNKIIPALQSRCTRFRFAPLSIAEATKKAVSIAELERIDLTQDGVGAIMELANGDMRKVLNMLQTVNAAYGQVNGDNVHTCTGTPRPIDIEESLSHLLNSPFGEACAALSQLMNARGLCLSDIVTRLVPLVCAVDDLPAGVLAFAVSQLADLEYRLSSETCERIQLVALVSIFLMVRDRTVHHYAAAEAAAAQ
eukprot:CRZ05869.1 hypothetical protein [Spongospora subterranea]